MRAFRALLLTTLSALVLVACNADRPPVGIEGAWIRQAPPGATAWVAYAKLHNNSGQDLNCDRISASDFGAAEIHRTLVEDGVSRMLRDQVLPLPSGGTAAFAPGIYHIMLFRPQRDLKPGDRSRLTVVCGDTRLDADFEIRSAAP